MESRKLSVLLSSVISQLTFLLLILLDSDSAPESHSSLHGNGNPFPLALCHEFSSALSLLTLSLRRRNNRKRPRLSEEEEEEEHRQHTFASFDRPHRTLDSFKNCFRMTSSTFEWLAGSLEPLLDCRDPVGTPLRLSTDLRLAIGLFRLASGADFPEISRQFRVTESTARFCANQLCRVLCTDFRFWAEFLGNPAELSRVSAVLEDRFGIPNCCGAAVCARFRTQRDQIAAQIVADSSSRILSIVAGFSRAGGMSDHSILKLSTLFQDIGKGKILNSPPIQVNGVEVDQYLIGDRNHPLLPWLMVPYSGSSEGEEERFNETLARVRVSSALKTVASLRNWGVLNRPIEEEVKTGVAYIGACSILHNALLMREDYSALADESESRDSVLDMSSECGNEHDSIHDKALVVRTALASKVKEFRDSITL